MPRATKTVTGSQSGFSLVETLVVLAIIGFVSSIVLLSAGPTGPALDREADRFAAKLAEARDIALIDNRPVLVEVTPDGYALRRRNQTGWAQPAPRDAISWEDGATVEAQGRRFPLNIFFDPMGMSEALSLTLYRDGRTETVEIDGVGEVRRTGDRDG